MIDFELIRSRRKTVAIHITRNAKVEVRAPLTMSDREIKELVDSKESWIIQNLTLMEDRIENKTGFSLHYGSTILLRGKEYLITSVARNRIGFDGNSFFVPENLNSDEIKYAIIKIYKRVARDILTQKVRRFAAMMGVSPAAIKVNSAKTRWGSCSGKNSINFTWRLVCGCDRVIDYVVVHELAHIKQHNHSDRFWAEVEKVLPYYREDQKKLKQLQDQLSCQDWD